ncbi:MAG TPA: hypothetical protein VFC51_19195 [Chloroflexota bacterium]|nr:hypothetical protein [Chloroflexota bacterium]
MDRIRLAYRDTDRTPVIYCIKEMAARHYDLDVDVVRIRDNDAYEAAIFDGSAEMICEHLEYLYEEAALGRRKATMFLAPVRSSDTQMVVGPDVHSLEDLRGKRIAIRAQGRPHAIIMRIRAMGLEGSVETVTVSDSDVGRWGLWKTVASGECAATFMSNLHMPAALAAGLRIFPAPEFDVVGHFSHACSAEFARTHDSIMQRYVQAAVHALCLMRLRRDDALGIVARDCAALMGLDQDRAELERWYDCIAGDLEMKPYPTPMGIANTYEIACAEWPGGKGINPLTLWDIHWLKQIDDEGFIDRLIASLGG